MKLAAIKKIDNVFNKLSEEVHFSLSDNMITEEDQEILTDLNGLLVNFNHQLLNLKVKNKSLGAKIQTALYQEFNNKKPEWENFITMSSSESTLAIEIKDTAFGANLAISEETYEYENEAHGDTYQDILDSREVEKDLINKLNFFQNDIELIQMYSCDWGNGEGIRFDLQFKKNFASDLDYKMNCFHLSNILIEFIEYIKNKFN